MNGKIPPGHSSADSQASSAAAPRANPPKLNHELLELLERELKASELALVRARARERDLEQLLSSANGRIRALVLGWRRRLDRAAGDDLTIMDRLVLALELLDCADAPNLRHVRELLGAVRVDLEGLSS